MGTRETFIILTYALIGISGALSLLVFTWGFGIYMVRLGTERRVQGIFIMEWAVRFAITTILLIGALRLLEK